MSPGWIPCGIKLGSQVALDAAAEQTDGAGVGRGVADPGVHQNGLSLGAYQVAFEVGPYVVGTVERFGDSALCRVPKLRL